MSELKGAKMEGSKVPAEEIKNPNLVAAIEKMQDDNTTENINKMIDEVMKAKFILPAKVTPKTEAKTTNGQTVMQQSTQVQFRLLENGNKEKVFRCIYGHRGTFQVERHSKCTEGCYRL